MKKHDDNYTHTHTYMYILGHNTNYTLRPLQPVQAQFRIPSDVHRDRQTA